MQLVCDRFLLAIISHPLFPAFCTVLLLEKPNKAVPMPQIPPFPGCTDLPSALKCKSDFTQVFFGHY